MFAGPNGSGKSTLKSVLPPELLGFYLNPDEIESSIRRHGLIDFSGYSLPGVAAEALGFLMASTFLKGAGIAPVLERIHACENQLVIPADAINAYVASVIADFLRNQFLKRTVSFTCETVMSSPDKVALLQRAQQLGYRTYLYFIATDDPAINISRVRSRVKLGGHPVPEDKIISRYHRSLGLLREAIRHANRSYIFDNSSDGTSRTWLAEITDGTELELKSDMLPTWFSRAVLR
jgi:predicted ABC-type ATPase